MLESLEKLSKMSVIGTAGNCYQFHGEGIVLAEEIQEEIDKYYLKRPMFEDGEPVQFGDKTIDRDFNMGKVQTIEFSNDDEVCVIFEDEDGNLFFHHSNLDGKSLKRPPAHDTQERIDGDLVQIFNGAHFYYEDHKDEIGPLGYPDFQDMLEACIRHLFKRQRKLLVGDAKC